MSGPSSRRTPPASLPRAREIAWREPAACYEALSAALPGPSAFLDSARYEARLGLYSYVLADPFRRLRFEGRDGFVDDRRLDPDDAAADDPFTRLQRELAAHPMTSRAGLPPFQGGAVGWLSYDLGQQLERLPDPRDPRRHFDDLAFALYDRVLAFDHQQGRAWIVSTGLPETDETARARRAEARIAELEALLDAVPIVDPGRHGDTGIDLDLDPAREDDVRVRASALSPGSSDPHPAPPVPVRSNFSRADYEAAVQRVIDYILAGDIYQANMTQCFSAVLPPGDSAWALYRRLRTGNAAPFAAYLDWGRQILASASPERFLRLRASGEVETRPIKGTRPRGATPEEDAALARELMDSQKDRAENVMIVDLLRNDLSRVCRPHSVRTPEICSLESYATVHHLVSAVEGRLEPGRNAVDLLRATFPGGSITGAPKIRAMEIIAELEPERRGPYCGSIAWLGFDGAMDSSIVIRTFCLRGRQIRFQAGGGIVADSRPAAEYDESLDKARALLRALGGRVVDSTS